MRDPIALVLPDDPVFYLLFLLVSFLLGVASKRLRVYLVGATTGTWPVNSNEAIREQDRRAQDAAREFGGLPHLSTTSPRRIPVCEALVDNLVEIRYMSCAQAVQFSTSMTNVVQEAASFISTTFLICCVDFASRLLYRFFASNSYSSHVSIELILVVIYFLCASLLHLGTNKRLFLAGTGIVGLALTATPYVIATAFFYLYAGPLGECSLFHALRGMLTFPAAILVVVFGVSAAYLPFVASNIVAANVGVEMLDMAVVFTQVGALCSTA
jgi:hypothetical protein